MIHAIADTHTLIWYLLGSSRLSSKAYNQFEIALKNGATIGISTISLVEIIYLMEKGRIQPKALSLFKENLVQEERLLEFIPVTYGIAYEMQNVSRDEVSDMPDRIIAATALYHRVPLISRDRKIQLSQIETIW